MPVEIFVYKVVYNVFFKIFSDVDDNKFDVEKMSDFLSVSNELEFGRVVWVFDVVDESKADYVETLLFE